MKRVTQALTVVAVSGLLISAVSAQQPSLEGRKGSQGEGAVERERAIEQERPASRRAGNREAVDGATVRANPTASAETGQFLRASELIGMQVHGTNNAELGEVQDLVIDGRTHEIKYLVLDTGLFADLGGKQPVIPWMLVETQLTAEADNRFLMVPLTEERIKTAPSYDVADIQLMQSAPWIEQVNQFYDADLQRRRVARPDLEGAPRQRTNRDDPVNRATNPANRPSDPDRRSTTPDDAPETSPRAPREEKQSSDNTQQPSTGTGTTPQP